jgi:hypothetical protein
MVDPVIIGDGTWYDRESIERWFDQCYEDGSNYRSPITNEILYSRAVVDNVGVKSIFDAAMNYLNEQDQLGNLNEEESILFRQYQIRAKEHSDKKQQLLEEQIKIRNMIVKCNRSHSMTYYAHYQPCPDYLRRFGELSIGCDQCHRLHIQLYGYYFHCSDCHFDICSICSIERSNKEFLVEDDGIIPSTCFLC